MHWHAALSLFSNWKEGEILVEPAPSSDERKALLFYESAEGGAGALAQLVSWNDGLMLVAKCALEIMHYDPASFGEAKGDPDRLSETGVPECVAGCYRCVLSYFNQPDHELIDRATLPRFRFCCGLRMLVPLMPIERREHWTKRRPRMRNRW